MGETDLFRAPLVIEYPFKRTTGPVVGGFLTGLREGILVGSKASDGRVIVPPLEYDPITSEPLTELVEVGPAGRVTTWAWVRQPMPKHPLAHPFAWALIQPDGAGSAMLGAVDAGAPDALAVGTRVVPVFKPAAEREGHIADLSHWELER